MSSPTTLSIASTPPEFYQVAALESKVFYNDPFCIVAFGPQRGSEPNLKSRAEELAQQGSDEKEGAVVQAILTNSVGGKEVVGAAGWKFVSVGGRKNGEGDEGMMEEGKGKGWKEEEGNGEKKIDWGIGANVKFCEDVFLGGDELMLRSTEGGDYAKLTTLIVSHEYQRRGIGSQILQAGLAKIDEMGLQCVLAASPEGLDLYKKFGFVEFETMRLKLWEYEGGEGFGEDLNVIMRRPAKGENMVV